MQSRAQKGSVKNKIAKPPSLKGIHSGLVKRSKDGKDEEASSPAISNGTLALDSHPRQPIKNRSFNDKQTRSKVNSVVTFDCFTTCLHRQSGSQIIVFPFVYSCLFGFG